MIWSGHNFSHVMTAQLLWLVRNHDLMWSLYNTFQQHLSSQDLAYGLINHLYISSLDALCEWRLFLEVTDPCALQYIPKKLYTWFAPCFNEFFINQILFISPWLFLCLWVIISLFQCPWSNPEEYGWINHMNPLRTMKSKWKENKTVCLFYGIYSTVKPLI